MSYIALFSKIFLINLFTFGGGYTIIPIIEQNFVEDLKLIEKEEMKNIISLANGVPGALAISTSFLVGYKVKGIKGAILSVIASVTPCIIIIAIIFNIYNIFITNPYIKYTMQGIGVSVSAILLVTVIKMILNLLKNKRKNIYIFIFLLALILNLVFNIPIIVILIIASILGSGII